MKRVILFSILFCNAMMAGAQLTNIDSLVTIARQQSGGAQVRTYAQIASATRDQNIDTAFYFATLADELAEKSNDNKARIDAWLSMAKVLLVKASYDMASHFFDQVLTLATSIRDDSMQGAAYNGIGTCQWQLGKHASALENHFKALSIYEAMANSQGIAASKSAISMVYQTQDKPALAEQYLQDALQILRQGNNFGLTLSTLHTLANIYGMQGKISDAMAIDAEGLRLASQHNFDMQKALFYDNMGNCYLYGNPPDFKKALEYFRMTLTVDSAFSNKKQMSDSYMNIGNTLIMQHHYDEALHPLWRSVQLAEESGYIQGKLNALQLLASVYQQANRFPEAYTTLQRSLQVKDSFINTSTQARMAEMQTIYETEKKQQQINLQQAQLSKKNFFLYGTLVLFVLLALLGLSFYRRTKLKQQTRLQNEILKQQEMATRAILEAEEGERQRIARDLHDGVGQMMSAAKMNLSAYEADVQQQQGNNDPTLSKVITLVDESCREIRNVSHNMMPNALLKNNLAAAITDFIEKLDKKSLQIHLYTEGLEKRMDPTLETVLYRILQELVNNVVRHAHASTLDISIIRSASGIEATIEDNGRGFDSSDPQVFNGIGLKNILTRVEYLKGSADFDSAPGRGTVVALHIPVKDA